MDTALYYILYLSIGLMVGCYTAWLMSPQKTIAADVALCLIFFVFEGQIMSLRALSYLAVSCIGAVIMPSILWTTCYRDITVRGKSGNMVERFLGNDGGRIAIFLIFIVIGVRGMIANNELGAPLYWVNEEKMTFRMTVRGAIQILLAGLMWFGVEGFFVLGKNNSMNQKNVQAFDFLSDMIAMSFHFFVVFMLMDVIAAIGFKSENLPGMDKFVLDGFCLVGGSVLTILLNNFLRTMAPPPKEETKKRRKPRKKTSDVTKV